MRSLYLRIWLTIVAVLALFALLAGALVQVYVQRERERNEQMLAERSQERFAAWAEVIERSLPPADAPRAEQAQAVREWMLRLRTPMALDDAQGRRVFATEPFLRREAEGWRPQPVKLDDGRTLWVMRPGVSRPPGAPPPGFSAARLLPGLPGTVGLALLALLLFVGVAAGAWPVVRRLTRRLEALKQGVETFGRGELSHRVAEDGRDEVAAVAASFNQAAGRVEALLRSHQSLLANASHELRSPLARLKMAVSLMDEAAPEQRAALKREIDANIGELDALVEEVLLASRLDATEALDRTATVDLLALAAEEASRVDAEVQGEPVLFAGDERLLRRALRNLLENARRYGGDDVAVQVRSLPAQVEVRVCDRGPGVPKAYRERIFEAFFRLPGHAERAGGVGLGLSLVRQIAQRHGGRVHCEARPDGGSCFVLTLPCAAP